MSYLSSVTTSTDYGVVQVGSNILVTDGIISVAQDLSPNASVTFGNVYVSNDLVAVGLVDVTGNLIINGLEAVTTVTPNASTGISLSGVVTTGPAVAFTVNNTGVVDFSAGTGLATTSNTGNIIVTNTGVVNLTANVGIDLSSNTGNVVVTNTGVTKLTAGTGISLSGNVGNITISSFGADFINTYGTTTSYAATLTDEYIGVYSASAVTITLPAGIDGRVYYIKDEYGQGSGKITVQPQVGELIDSKPNYIISVPYQCIAVVFRAGQWRII